MDPASADVFPASQNVGPSTSWGARSSTPSLVATGGSSSYPSRSDLKHPPPVVSPYERFVPEPQYSGSSRHTTHRDDSSSLKNHTPASLREASGQSLPASQSNNASPENGIGIHISPGLSSHDSPWAKSSPAKSSLQDKVCPQIHSVFPII